MSCFIMSLHLIILDQSKLELSTYIHYWNIVSEGIIKNGSLIQNFKNIPD